MDTVKITGPDFEVDWTKDPVFEFACETDALETLEALSEQRRAAREQARQIMRYMTAAVKATRNMDEAERPTPTAILNYSRLARQTVYDMLGEA